MEPYEPENDWILRAQAPGLPIKFDGHCENMLIYGLEKLVFTNIKIVAKPYPSKTCTIYGDAFVPTLTIDSDLIGKSFFIFNFQSVGHFTMVLSTYYSRKYI